MSNFIKPADLPAIFQIDDITAAICEFDLSNLRHDTALQLGVNRSRRFSAFAPKRQAAHLAGRWCAARALEASGCNRELQEPCVGQAPVWPKGMLGSISHSEDIAVAVAASSERYTGIGVDCETLISSSIAKQLMPLILSPNELPLPNLPYDASEILTYIFSLKESAYKALSSSHFRFSFQDAHVRFVDQCTAEIAVTVSDRLPSLTLRARFAKVDTAIFSLAIA